MESIEVQYLPLENSGDESSPLKVRILPVSRSRYREVLDLLHLLLIEFREKVAYPGELLMPDNENVWGNISKLTELLPLSGGGKLDIDRLSDRDLIRIFFTAKFKKDETDGQIVPDTPVGEENSGYYSSEIARLHGFNFFKMLQRAEQKN